MTRLAQRELRRFSAAVAALSDRRLARADLSDHFLHAIADLIPVDRASYNEFDRRRGCLLRAHSIGEPGAPQLVASLNAHMHEHPGFNRPDSASDWPAPNMISDALSQRQFRALGLYQDHFRLYGIHYQLGIAFALDRRRKITFGLNRARRDFSEEERTLLELLRPHLLRVWRETSARERMQAALEMRDHALRGAGSAIVVLGAKNEIAFCSESARRLLTRAFGSEGERVTRLPAPLRSWLRDRLASQKEIVFARKDYRLSVRLLRSRAPESHRQLLKLFERPLNPPVEPLLALGLSTREADVLLWLAQGKRNAEIALICGLHISTVATHLRNIFGKLEVETRTAAAALAWEAIAAAQER